jgi:hypothetical protein
MLEREGLRQSPSDQAGDDHGDVELPEEGLQGGQPALQASLVRGEHKRTG